MTGFFSLEKYQHISRRNKVNTIKEKGYREINGEGREYIIENT